ISIYITLSPTYKLFPYTTLFRSHISNLKRGAIKMHTREQLEAIIPTLKDNVSLAKSLLEKHPNDESLKITLDSYRKTLNEYLQRLEKIKVGRPAIGITRKVALTLSEDN